MFTKLRSLPLLYREALALSFSLGVTLIIFLGWFSVLPVRLGTDKVIVTKGDTAETEKRTTEVASPFKTLGEGLSSVGASVGELSKILKESGSQK